MKHVTQSFLLPCTPDVFWQTFLDPAYVRALYFEALGFKGFEVVRSDASSRVLRIVPKLNLPQVLAKLIGDAFAYEEHGSLDRAKSEWTWQMVQPKDKGAGSGLMKEVVTTSGQVNVEAVGANECRRVDALQIEGKLFGLGGLIESSAEKEARTAWDKEFPFMKAWLARTKPAA